MPIPYYVFISGNIGVGKSTTINAMKLFLHDKNCLYVKEYIDYSPIIGERCLELNKCGQLPDFDFQNFILDCYECQLNKQKNEEIIVMERHPYEALEVFCKSSKMLQEELYKLRDRIDELMVKYCIPSPSECKIFKYNTSLFKTKGIVDDVCGKLLTEFANMRVDGIMINLYCFIQDALERINKRGRLSERDITAHVWSELQDRYVAFFEKYK